MARLQPDRLASQEQMAPPALRLGRWQAGVRTGALALGLGLFAAGVPGRARQLVAVTAGAEQIPGLPLALTTVFTSRLEPTEVEALHALGFSLSAYAAYSLAFEVGLVLVCAAVALTTFWRRSAGWLTLWVSLVLLGTTATSPEIFLLTSTWVGWSLLPTTAVGLLGMVSALHILFLAPDGRFVPRWTLRLAAGFTGGMLGLIVTLVAGLRAGMVPAVLPIFIVAILAWLCLSGVGIGSQVYRYRHVSGPVERQQVRWVAAGLAAVTVGMVDETMQPASVGLWLWPSKPRGTQ